MTSALSFTLADVGGHGADDCETDDGVAYTLTASRDGRQVGYLKFNDRGDVIRIRWIEVTCHRQGIATALMDELARIRSDHHFVTGGFTAFGEAFFAAYEQHTGIAVCECRDTPDNDA